ncbi:hypothetical protein BABINDRAFT_72882 [Babjeviella inositovora NRRL Y-12698]|uniref:Nuclear speckle splicing regulatory protein 1 N-terminal domain-containing protein n=1 Tax=Babjeviella inositovora NRRL Y-12698 TaxID=984486 RepID=A0A1E3QZI7_9ASCO|nr:uncharacterized protein BABINDRAFT_72882 [Babjeviella inositovora NRRL Y-12698]ODQ82492.1 hypothetical protein BABINDRAFT_72882 [Babjeviella inositovora NRRL Y-12698]
MMDWQIIFLPNGLIYAGLKSCITYFLFFRQSLQPNMSRISKNVFSYSDEEDQEDDRETSLMAARKQAEERVRKMEDEEDYEAMFSAPVQPKPVEKPPVNAASSRYIEKLLQAKQRRETDRVLLINKKQGLVRAQEEVSGQYKDKEIFVSKSYQKAQKEAQSLVEEETVLSRPVFLSNLALNRAESATQTVPKVKVLAAKEEVPKEVKKPMPKFTYSSEEESEEEPEPEALSAGMNVNPAKQPEVLVVDLRDVKSEAELSVFRERYFFRKKAENSLVG